MGKACAKVIVAHGGTVLIASRSLEKLERAAKEINEFSTCSSSQQDQVQIAVLDAGDEAQVANFAESITIGDYTSLVVSCAGRAPHGTIATLETQLTRELFDSKFWSAYLCSKYLAPKLANGGSIAFVAGVLNRRPGLNCSPLAATNGALEGLTRALALELGPTLRVNCLSPGFCDTERFDHMDATKKEQMFRNTAESLPLQKIGSALDMGEALFYLLCAEFCTGCVLDCDGGHGIRQYASAVSDPMRNNLQ